MADFFTDIAPFIKGLTDTKVAILGIVSKKLTETLTSLGCWVSLLDTVEKLDSIENTNFSLVVSCDLFSNNKDSFVQTTLEKVLISLETGGTFVFCETCFEENNDGSLHARKPSFYSSYVESVSLTSKENGVTSHHVFEITLSRVLRPSNKVLWLVTKVKSNQTDSFGFNTFQEFLNSKQYSVSGISRYEKIFGHGFISTGGFDTTKEFVDYLKLKPGEHVLDVGSGIGGGDFYMAENFGVKVTGIDLSWNVVAIALERWSSKNYPNVNFEICDATKRDFPEGSFDVIYSRDTILHISNKKHLFSSFLKWLKPGGRLLISDYCCCEGRWSEDYVQYVKQRGYFLLTLMDYGKLLEGAGFVRVKAENWTNRFVEMLKKELERITNNKEDFSEDDFEALLAGWKDKLKRSAEGHQIWGMFYAEKA